MKSIRIGLTTGLLASLLHERVYLANGDGLSVTFYFVSKEQIENDSLGKPLARSFFPRQLVIEAKKGTLTISSNNQNNIQPLGLLCPDNNALKPPPGLFSVATIKPQSGRLIINTQGASGPGKSYGGQLLIIAEQDKMRLILQYPLEDYVQSVLQGEMPPNYHIEAIKAQAICARSYALKPRIDHKKDFCNVCDSYQCCQCFNSKPGTPNSSHAIASSATKGQILSYQDKPVLALFSSCAGGHTENYEDCFSDWDTKIFPPKAIPYLRGISECLDPNDAHQIVDEAHLKKLWQLHEPLTIDSWSKRFRWVVKLSNQDLESHIHHNLAQLLKQEDFAPFVVLPPSGIFGEILSFTVTKRGVGGTAINLKIETSKGDWLLTKGLTIRNLFKMQNLGLNRLSSARIFFNQIRDTKEQLLYLYIYGLGSGHGVGLQQIGAEGLARANKNYREILAHYYTDTHIVNI